MIFTVLNQACWFSKVNTMLCVATTILYLRRGMQVPTLHVRNASQMITLLQCITLFQQSLVTLSRRSRIPTGQGTPFLRPCRYISRSSQELGDRLLEQAIATWAYLCSLFGGLELQDGHFWKPSCSSFPVHARRYKMVVGKMPELEHSLRSSLPSC